MTTNEFQSGLQTMRSYIDYLHERKLCVKEEEKRAFTVNGVLLSTDEQVKREVTKLLSVFAHDIDFEYDKYSKVFNVIKSLMNQEQKKAISQEVLRRVIVHMNLELGILSSFYTTFVDMDKKYSVETFCYDRNMENFTFEWLRLQYA